MSTEELFDAVVIGGGPAGATAADELARQGHKVLLLDRAGRIKPCGGAIPPRLIRDFDIPDELLVARARSARMVAPSGHKVDIPIDDGFVGMVDRDQFDEWLRERAASHGAERRTGTFQKVTRDAAGTALVHYLARDRHTRGEGQHVCVRAHCIIGADGARSEVARQCVPGAKETPFVFAYHEIVRKPQTLPAGYDPSRCDVVYDGQLLPGLLRVGVSAWRHAVGRHGKRRQGLLVASRRLGAARGGGAVRRTDRSSRGRADPHEAAAALGQRA